MSVETNKVTSGRPAELKAVGNPEGKGVNGVLLDWRRTEPRGVVAKPERQVLAELFTSMLALSATFKYRPAPGKLNYLYWIRGEWSLSLIGPEEWSGERSAGFAGTVILQRDMTWTIELSDRLADNKQMADAVGNFYKAFTESLNTDRTLEEILPFHFGRLPYFQRLHANALSRSLRASCALGGKTPVSCREYWRQMLPRQPLALIGVGELKGQPDDLTHESVLC
ncbi:MAG: DUF2452 domain-containing protein [Gammaproteobacteria bacterium]|nr:DUF2452 domain-containing protein [Gammaproteobacteria bacterium]